MCHNYIYVCIFHTWHKATQLWDPHPKEVATFKTVSSQPWGQTRGMRNQVVTAEQALPQGPSGAERGTAWTVWLFTAQRAQPWCRRGARGKQ